MHGDARGGEHAVNKLHSCSRAFLRRGLGGVGALMGLLSACGGVVETQDSYSGTTTGSTGVGGAAGSTGVGGTAGVGGATTSSASTSSTSTSGTASCPADDGGPSGALIGGKAFGPGLRITQVVIDPDGYPIIGGTFVGQVTLGGTALSQSEPVGEGTRDVFVAKLDGCGEVLWATALGTPGLDALSGLDVDPQGHVFGAMGTSGGGVSTSVFRLLGSGELAWERTWEGVIAGERQGIAATGDGGVVTAGFTVGTVDVGSGPVAEQPGDVLLVKLDEGGGLLWTSWVDFQMSLKSVCLAASTMDGELFLAGVSEPGYSFGRTNAVGQLYDEVPGDNGLTMEEMRVAGDAEGHFFFAQRYVSTGMVFVHGETGFLDYWVQYLVLDGASGQVRSAVIAATPEGSLRVVARYWGPIKVFDAVSLPAPSGTMGFVFLRATLDGQLVWASVSGGDLNDASVDDAAVGPDGRLWVVGAVDGSLPLGDGTAIETGGGNPLPVVLRIAP